jgi:hypothetical protein
MNASKMMARMTTTTQKKNTMMPGIAYPATVLALATAASYPLLRDLSAPETPRRPMIFRTTSAALAAVGTR